MADRFRGTQSELRRTNLKGIEEAASKTADRPQVLTHSLLSAVAWADCLASFFNRAVKFVRD